MRESTAWKTLLEFDPDIQHAVGAIKKYGSPAEERLAKAFLSVKDKSLLPNMTAKISEDFERQELAKAERAKVIASAGSNNSAEPVEISPDHGYRSDAQARIVKDREKRSIAMMDDIEQNGMICRYTNKTVSDMSIYFGASRDDHGYAKLVYTDGTAELRSGQFFMACRKELE